MTNLIDDITEWLKKTVCAKLEFKAPARGGREGAGYEYKLLNPQAFPCFCPPQDGTNLPTAPSVTVQIDGFTDDPTEESEIKIALVFVVWNPGLHDNSGATPKFEKNLDGWRDLWHFIDAVRREIKKNFNIAGFEIIGDITGRPLAGESAIMGTYPYFFGEVTFTVGTISSSGTSAAIRQLL
jgi:hypothetical protein